MTNLMFTAYFPKEVTFTQVNRVVGMLITSPILLLNL